jgi:hypothetical protein
VHLIVDHHCINERHTLAPSIPEPTSEEPDVLCGAQWSLFLMIKVTCRGHVD